MQIHLPFIYFARPKTTPRSSSRRWNTTVGRRLLPLPRPAATIPWWLDGWMKSYSRQMNTLLLSSTWHDINIGLTQWQLISLACFCLLSLSLSLLMVFYDKCAEMKLLPWITRQKCPLTLFSPLPFHLFVVQSLLLPSRAERHFLTVSIATYSDVPFY